MKRSTLRLLILFLVLFIPMLDAALWHIDPTGIVQYVVDSNALHSQSLPSPDGLRYTPGNYRFRGYQVTIGLDGFRAVADSQLSECRIAFVGDSITFGMGSDLSFVDLLAPDIPAQTINAGIVAYSASNVLAELSMVPADGYVWLIVPNDDAEFLRWRLPPGNIPPAMVLYGRATGIDPDEPERFMQYASQILNRDDVLAFAFADLHLSDVIAQSFPDVQMIPYFKFTVSAVDGHPDPAGHQQIADALRPAVLEFASRQCA